MPDRIYRIRNNRWSNALLIGLDICEEDGIRVRLEDEVGNPEHFHTAFLQPIDSAAEDSTWGRLHYLGQNDGNTAICVYAVALNEQAGMQQMLRQILYDPAVSREKKLRLMEEAGAIRCMGRSEMLLYQLEGRYLYLAVDFVGDGEASLSQMRIYAQGDNFLQTFPEVYRERNSFFHRFLSVFSTIYNDFQEEIDDLPLLLDIDQCPAELLPLYASWLGIDLAGDFLPEQVCRELVREGYQLDKRKGTHWAVKRVVEIVLGSKAQVLEHNTMRGYLLSDGAQIPPNLREGGVYDVTILVHGQMQETDRHQLMFLLDQFKPARARLHLVLLSDNSVADGNTYLDLNAAIPQVQAPKLDADASMSDVLALT